VPRRLRRILRTAARRVPHSFVPVPACGVGMWPRGKFATKCDGPCAQENLRPATLADVMGVRPEPILADWVHGELRCPEGKLLQFTRHAFGGIYERDRLFRFSSGCLNEEMLRLNPPDPIWYRLDATGGRERVDDWREVDVVLDDPFKPDEIPQGHVFWGRPDPSVAPLVEGYTIPGCTIFGRPYNQDG
jgi:hypothetical protein